MASARTTRALLGAIVFAAGLSCGDPAGPTGGPTVRFCPSGGSSAFPTLREAVEAVASGGTILVCDGIHDLDEQLIDKPLTLRAEHHGGATIQDVDTLRVPQRGRPAIRVDGVAMGVVRFVDINFAIGGRGVVLGGLPIAPSIVEGPATFLRVEFDSTNWVGRSLNASFGIVIRGSTVPLPRVEITRSAFSDMYIGIFPGGAVEVNTTKSTFSRMVVAGPDYSGAGTSSSFGRIEDNVLNECGTQGCIRIPSGGAITIARNTMHGTAGVASLGGIVLLRSGAITVAGPLTIEDNTIVGAIIPGGTGAGGWTFQSGVSLTDSTTTVHTVRRNHITGAYSGIVANASVTAEDNFIADGFFAVTQAAAGTITFRRNNVTGMILSFQAPIGNLGDFRCNWWGSVNGPANPPSVPTTLYTPYATTAIAGTTITCP